MKAIRFIIITLLCTMVQGAWAVGDGSYVECRWVGGNTDGHIETENKKAEFRYIGDSEILNDSKYAYVFYS